ncbi:MAG: 4Fe-4S ferredoxin [Metallosphaera sp.]|uniref:4Fe-4S binding protein n=1 Tax=Metallosphaera sp. TaxID=2020860 RepID=UPI0031648C48
MAIDFWILGSVLRREFVNKRLVLFLISIILLMSGESISIGYIAFSGGTFLIEPIILILSSIPALISFTVKSETLNVRKDLGIGVLLSLTTVYDELSMGYLYGTAFVHDVTNPFLLSVENPAFGLMMLADGIYFLLISRNKTILEGAITTFALSMAFIPSLYTFSKTVELYLSLVSSLIMIVNVVMIYLIEIKRVTLQGQLVSISLALFDFIMMLGLSLFASMEDLWLISISMVISMAWYFILIIHQIPSRRISLKLRYPFLFLVLVNLAELTMGFGETVLGFNLTNSLYGVVQSAHVMNQETMSKMGSLSTGSMSSMHMRSPFTNPFWWLFPINPLSMFEMYLHGSLFQTVLMAPYMLVMATTMAPFYVIMMGGEMAYLVYERFKRARTAYLKNWTLAIIVGIPIFVVLIPYYTNFYVFGMSGMIFPVTLTSFIVSLIAIALASTLFGRGVYCNLVCMSAHMFSNTFFEQFNAKRSSHIWDYLRWLFLVPMLVAFSLYVISQVHIVKMSIDPLNFYGMFTLNYIWWFFFFLTPVFGTYACARQGWCGFGTFVGIFNKLVFKVKAKHISTCETCESKDCESSCPVKIPISQDVLTKGYVNRVSCVGCAKCVDSCPYDNLEVKNFISLIKR